MRATFAAALLAAAGIATADEPQNCAAISDATARLACYDAQAANTPPAQPEAPKVEEPADIDHVDARIVGSFKGWNKGTLFKLDNGQAWKVDGDDAAYHSDIPDNPKVTIDRGYAGGYWMTIETVDRKVKVRRVTELRKKK